MKNLPFKKLMGYTSVHITGAGAERFINKLVRENIQIWDIRRVGAEELEFKMFLNDVPKIRKAVRYHRVKVKFKKRAGLPFLMKKMGRRMGFLIGSFLAAALIFLLSNMIWGVEIRGASPEIEYKISNQLKEMGVKIGQLQFFVDDPETIQQKITNLNDEITWIGVEIKGTTYHFQVVEKERPEKPEATSPRHLVAKKEAVIVDYFVEEGKPAIKINDFVKQGQLLVSGLIGREDDQKIVSAKGVVYGKTWYRVESWVSLRSEHELLTGDEYTTWHIKFGNFPIQIWGFNKGQYKSTKVEVDEKTAKLFKWTIPVSLVKTTNREIDKYTKNYSKEEAKMMALELARIDLERNLPKDAKIIEEKILHEQEENGKFKLTIIYDVIENIVQEQPIIQSN